VHVDEDDVDGDARGEDGPCFVDRRDRADDLGVAGPFRWIDRWGKLRM